jgi:hypothetical protein
LQQRRLNVASLNSHVCKSIDAPENGACKHTVAWAAIGGGKNDPQAEKFFRDMPAITGVNFKDGNVDDFHRLYYCSPPGGIACSFPPCDCSRPPCGTCFGGTMLPPRRPCKSGAASIECVPPPTPMAYRGQAWPSMSFPGKGEMHIFAIGDWGGMDGTLNPIEGRPALVCYDWGRIAGPSVFPRSRWDRKHSQLLCSHSEFVDCYNSRGQRCVQGCGYVDEVDSRAQELVAKAMKARAAQYDPQFILNVGDNFYWGGIEKTCGTPMNEISFTAYHQFDQIFERMYQGQGLRGKPWLSVLGNHDWGGRVFINGWDQQIAYTWASDRWVMPAPYWSQHVEYPDLDFTVDIWMLDSNFMGTDEPSRNSEHNICGARHNPNEADCSVADGPSSVESCPQFFRDLWQEQQVWLEQKMSESTATWRIIVTHFPCGHEQAWYNKLYKQFGFDLLVTGHRHNQELWTENDGRNLMGAACIVTGGGGGISSEASPDLGRRADWYGEAEYGFYDLTINATELRIQSINWDNTIAKTHTVLAKTKEEEDEDHQSKGDHSEQEEISQPSDVKVSDISWREVPRRR